MATKDDIHLHSIWVFKDNIIDKHPRTKKFIAQITYLDSSNNEVTFRYNDEDNKFSIRSKTNYASIKDFLELFKPATDEYNAIYKIENDLDDMKREF